MNHSRENERASFLIQEQKNSIPLNINTCRKQIKHKTQQPKEAEIIRQNRQIQRQKHDQKNNEKNKNKIPHTLKPFSLF